MGTSQQQPFKARLVAECVVERTAKNEFIVKGDVDILREFFESDPELWLRCLAQKAENEA